jgi:hypothetical protein
MQLIQSLIDYFVERAIDLENRTDKDVLDGFYLIL